ADLAVQALNVGDTLTDSFTYTVSDGQGGTSSTTLTITIHGTDDNPVAVADHGDATEAGVNPDGSANAGSHATGNVLTNDSDVDNAHTDLVVSAVTGGTVGSPTAGSHGSVTIDANGHFDYAINDADLAVQALNVGDTLTDSFTYTVSDGQGGTSSTTLTITIHGTDDNPVAVADHGDATEAGVNPDGSANAGSHATGNVLTNDSDV